MEKLLEDIEKIEFTTGSNFSYDLDREFELISSNLESNDKKLLKDDFEYFFNRGKFLVLNTFSGNLLFLKVSEKIERIKIEFRTDLNKIEASTVFESSIRRQENIKYKPDAGKIQSMDWIIELIFPNLNHYQKIIQKALLIIVGKIVKRICEYGRTNFAYMKIENEFEIELLIDGQIESKLKVELNK